MSERQPIETAPTDGTRILTWGSLHEDGIGEIPTWQISWFVRDGGWISAEWGSHEPLYWMPLPSPPSTIDKET